MRILRMLVEKRIRDNPGKNIEGLLKYLRVNTRE